MAPRDPPERRPIRPPPREGDASGATGRRPLRRRRPVLTRGGTGERLRAVDRCRSSGAAARAGAIPSPLRETGWPARNPDECSPPVADGTGRDLEAPSGRGIATGVAGQATQARRDAPAGQGSGRWSARTPEWDAHSRSPLGVPDAGQHRRTPCGRTSAGRAALVRRPTSFETTKEEGGSERQGSGGPALGPGTYAHDRCRMAPPLNEEEISGTP
jgi:hypothetical protein